MITDQFFEIVGGKLTGFKGGTKWNNAETAVIPEGVTAMLSPLPDLIVLAGLSSNQAGYPGHFWDK